MGKREEEEEEKDLTSFARFKAGGGIIAKHRGRPLEVGKSGKQILPQDPCCLDFGW